MSRNTVYMGDLQKLGVTDQLVQLFPNSFKLTYQVRAIEEMIQDSKHPLTVEEAVAAVNGFTHELAWGLYMLYKLGVRGEDLRQCGRDFTMRHAIQIEDMLGDPNNTLTPQEAVAKIRESMGDIVPLRRQDSSVRHSPLSFFQLQEVSQSDLLSVTQGSSSAQSNSSGVAQWLTELPERYSPI